MLNKIINKLKTIKSYDAYIPNVWNTVLIENNAISIKNTNLSKVEKISKVRFPDYFIETLTAINNANMVYSNSPNYTIYNMLARLTTTFNHNQESRVNNIDKLTNEPNKFKSSGTLFKTIALLPYIKSLGVDILYLLPITSIGKDGKKGNLGSPYSINDPYKLDDDLNEPLLDMSIEEQFSALIEAAHKLGMKVVCEFIFRTSSRDSDLAISHPEWFYWIKEEYEDQFHSPIFTKNILETIKKKIDANDYDNLPEPDLNYQKQFTVPPSKVKLIDGKVIGTCDNGDVVVIPGAFADYPPDDIQPPWADVTYFKLYNNPYYDYMAYNTIRMYDNELAKPRYEATALWRHIENIVPYYQKRFGIDGIMIDMGHALPHKLLNRIISKARKNNKDFIFWEENFIPSETSFRQGFDCVLGFLPFNEHQPDVFSKELPNLYKLPIKCFATSETHNTPRTASRKGDINLSKITYIINKLLPLPTFIHSGFELCEKIPVNTGLGFEDIDTTNLSADVLPLFSTAELNWSGDDNIIEFIWEINDLVTAKKVDVIIDKYLDLLPEFADILKNIQKEL